jgi:type VI secretion system secreted protein VgrG
MPNPPSFSLGIQGQERSEFLVLAFDIEEAISQPFRVTIDAVTEPPPNKLESLLNKTAHLSVGDQSFHGHLCSVQQGKIGKRLSHYQFELVPFLSYLKFSNNRRIYQDKTTQQIIGDVLKGHGLLEGRHVQFHIGPEKPTLHEYCVQYDETDLHFISRLCEADGIFYYFQHTLTGHVLTFADQDTEFYMPEPAAVVMPFIPMNGMAPEYPVAHRFDVRKAARTSRVTQRDYDFERAHVQLESAKDSEASPNLEQYIYPGNIKESASLRSRRALERFRGDFEIADGSSDQPDLRPGIRLELEDHPEPTCNATWLLTSLHHEGRCPQVLQEYSENEIPVAPDRIAQGYRNHFTALPRAVPIRPALNHDVPKIEGMQTAVVVGPEQDDIHCDQWGRIKVRFHWDRSEPSDNSSCWIRVASSWAGSGYGAVTVPRVGMEVLVAFEEGLACKPIIVGCLSNNTQRPPYSLPDNKTKTVLRSKSIGASSGYNELHLEDKTNEELIYLRAQRDMEQLIQHDSRIEIGNERLETIRGSSTSVLKAEQNVTVTGARKVQILADDHLDIAGSSHTRITGDALLVAGQEVHISGEHIVIDGGVTLSLSVNGQHIVLNPAGIFSSTPILPGGVPVPGTPASPLPPGDVAPLSAGQLEVTSESRTLRSSTSANAPESPNTSSSQPSPGKRSNKNLYSN